MGLASLVEDLFQENTPYLPVQLDYQSGQRERIAKSLLAPRLVDNPHWESPIGVGCRVYSIGFRSLALGWVCRPDGPQTRASLVQPIADRVAQNLEITSEFLSTYQNSAHGIHD